jgi:Matrixin
VNLDTTMRAVRALTVVFACAGLAMSPGVADAGAKRKGRKTTMTRRGAHATKPVRSVKAVSKSTTAGGLVNRIGLTPDTQLAALDTAIGAAPTWFSGVSNGCTSVTAMLASQPGPVIAGNFRDGAGGCYVWLNLQQSSMLTGPEICKVALHEMGHLGGLEHSADPADVMFAPFRSDPIPPPCLP